MRLVSRLFEREPLSSGSLLFLHYIALAPQRPYHLMGNTCHFLREGGRNVLWGAHMGGEQERPCGRRASGTRQDRHRRAGTR